MLIYHELVSLLKTFLLNINQSSCWCREAMLAVWPDWAIFYTLGNFSMPGAIIILPISPTHSRQFLLRCQNLSFTRGILLGQLLWTFGNFFSSRCTLSHTFGSLEPFLKRYFVLLCSLIRLYNSGKIPDNLITLIVFDFYQKLQRNLNLQPLYIASDILPQRK